MRKWTFIAPAIAGALACTPARADPGDPVVLGSGVTLDPLVDLRVRYAEIDQPAVDAQAIVARLRAGIELRHASGLSFLAEG